MFSKIPGGVKMFAVLWLVVALVWPLREVFLAQRVIASVKGGWVWPQIDSKNQQKIAPDDLIAQSEALFTQFFSTDRDARVLKQWDELAAKHPREVWLRADRLRATTTDGVFRRSPPATWMTPDVLNQTIECARAARTVEPDNGFWAWMEAVFALKAGRESEAEQALERAANAPKWNDYVDDFTRRGFALLERTRPLVYEEKLPFYASQLYSHLGPMRAVSETFVERGLALRARGNEKKAFQLFGVVLRAAQVFRKNTSSQIGALVAFDIEKDLWRRVAATQGVFVGQNIVDDAKWQRAVDAFGRIATKANRADLAKLSQLELKAGIQERIAAQTPPDGDLGRNIWGVSTNQLRVGTQGAFLLVYLAGLAFAGAFFWIFGALWTSSNTLVPSRGETTRAVNFSLWCVLGALALLWFWNVGADFAAFGNTLYYGDDTTIFQAHDLAPAAFPTFALFAWLLPVAWMTKRRGFARREPAVPTSKTTSFRAVNVSRVLLWIFAGVFGMISFGSGANIWQNTPFAFPIPLIALAVCVLALLVLETVKWKQHKRPAPIRRVVALGFAVLSIIVGVLTSPNTAFWMLPLLLVVGFALTMLPLRSGDSAGALDFLVASASRSAGVLALIWSIVFVIGALSIWPIRAKLNHQLERRLTIGERAWLKEQLPNALKPL